MDLVSVLIPCYNHEKYIDDCMISLCNQTYKNIEIIIVDDSSEDKSFEKLVKWEEKLKNCFTSTQISQNPENLGIVKTLNNMLRIAQGKYIKLLASDDLLMPSAIETFLLYAGRSDDDIYFSNIAFLPEGYHYGLFDFEQLSVRYHSRPEDGRNLTGVLCGNNYIAAPGVFIPRATFEKYGLFDERYCLEDFEFWLRVSVSGSFRYIDKVTTLYRQNINSLSRFDLSLKSRDRHRKFHDDKEDIFARYQQYADDKQKSSFYNKELSSAIGVNDRDLVLEIFKKMLGQGIMISVYNYMRIPLVISGIYPIFKKIKHVTEWVKMYKRT